MLQKSGISPFLLPEKVYRASLKMINQEENFDEEKNYHNAACPGNGTLYGRMCGKIR